MIEVEVDFVVGVLRLFKIFECRFKGNYLYLMGF